MKQIIFTPINAAAAAIINPPTVASKNLPSWYKNQPGFSGEKIVLNDSGSPNTTIKKCMPVLDDMTAGYFVTAAADILVSFDGENKTHSFSWSLETEGHDTDSSLGPLVSTHSTDQISHVPIPPGFDSFPFKFNNYYRITTPLGYSCLFRHPSWRFDLPFYTFSGLVDTDKHPVAVNFPFLIKDQWEGVIEAGTPIAQVIPFRRTEWECCVRGKNNVSGAMKYRIASKKLYHRYKDNWRSVKSWR